MWSSGSPAPTNLPNVTSACPRYWKPHQGTIRILHTLDPIGVAMAGADEFDPFRD